MELPLVQVDAFAAGTFSGNPAAVMRLPHWLPDAVLQAIAMENNLSETAFLVGTELRWFTPTVEVELCGHATLAAGAVVLEEDGGDEVVFSTRSGPLAVRRARDGYTLELPAIPAGTGEAPPALLAAIGGAAIESHPVRSLHRAAYWLVVYGHERDVLGLAPDLGTLRAMRCNVICTAAGTEVDFVSRFFAPASGVDEDPVTGSAHCTLAPFWAARLGRNPLRARQVSRRGGELVCEVAGDRVRLGGRVAPYLRGVVTIPD